VMRMLRRLDRLTSGKANSKLRSKPVTNVRAEALAPTIRKLRKAAFVSIKAIAQVLNEREVPTPRGGKTSQWMRMNGEAKSHR